VHTFAGVSVPDIEAVLELLKRRPGDPAAHLAAAQHYLSHGDLVAAGAHLRQTERAGARAGLNEAWRGYAELAAKLGRDVPSLRAYQRVIAAIPSEPSLRAAAGKVWRRLLDQRGGLAAARALGATDITLQPPARRLQVGVHLLEVAPWNEAAASLSILCARWFAELLSARQGAAVLPRRDPEGRWRAPWRPLTLAEHSAVFEATQAEAVIGGRLSLEGAAGQIELWVEREGVRTPLVQQGLQTGRLVAGVESCFEKAMAAVAGVDELVVPALSALDDTRLFGLAGLAAGQLASGATWEAAQLASQDPFVQTLCLDAADVWIASGALDDAERLLSALYGWNAASASVHTGLAELHRARGELEARAAWLERASELDSEGGRADRRAAVAWEQAEDHARAAAAWVRVSRSEVPAERAEALARLGLLHILAGRVEEAEARFEAAREVDRRSPWPALGWAALAARGGDRVALARHLRSAVASVDPDERDPWVELAFERLFEQGAERAFLSVVSAATRDGLHTPLLAGALALATLAQDRRAAAKVATRLEAWAPRARVSSEEAERLRRLMARLYVAAAEDSRASGDAIRAGRRALELDPESGPARVILGEALLREGRAREAVTVLEQAPGLPGVDQGVWALLAKGLLAMGRREHAREAAERAGAAGWMDPELARLSL